MDPLHRVIRCRVAARPRAAAPSRPTAPDPQFDHQYDKKENYRGRFGLSGKKGALSGTRSSAEARSSTIFSEPGVPPHAGVQRRTAAALRDQTTHGGAGAERDIEAAGACSIYQTLSNTGLSHFWGAWVHPGRGNAREVSVTRRAYGR